jgi:protein-S-isoprenylcysteine O-methyltransferase Ste14
MSYVVDYLPWILYFLLFTGLKFGDQHVLPRPGSNIRQGWGVLTVWLILAPMWLVLIGPVLEFILLGNRPTLLELTLGAVLLIAAGYFSIKGYLNLEEGFAQAIERDDTTLVVTGIYKIIRNPVSLGNILFCVACPLLLAAGPSWIPALVGVLGVMLRISIEESFLQRHVQDYEAYKERTWALIPYIY